MSKTNMDTIKDEVALRVFAELLARNTYSADWFKKLDHKAASAYDAAEAFIKEREKRKHK